MGKGWRSKAEGKTEGCAASAVTALDDVDGLAGRPLGAVVLFAVALATYAARSIAWPVATGRDLDDQLTGVAEPMPEAVRS